MAATTTKRGEPVQPLTDEERAIVRAYEAQRLREYRKRNREREKLLRERSTLRRALAAIESGELDAPPTAGGGDTVPERKGARARRQE